MDIPGKLLALVDADAAAARPDAWLDLPEATAPAVAADVLDALLAADESAQLLGLLVGGRRLGVASRARLWGPGRAFDDAAGLTLPGESPYVLVSWTCPVCAARVWRIHSDPRQPPQCPHACGPLRAEVT